MNQGTCAALKQIVLIVTRCLTRRRTTNCTCACAGCQAKFQNEQFGDRAKDSDNYLEKPEHNQVTQLRGRQQDRRQGDTQWERTRDSRRSSRTGTLRDARDSRSPPRPRERGSGSPLDTQQRHRRQQDPPRITGGEGGTVGAIGASTADTGGGDTGGATEAGAFTRVPEVSGETPGIGLRRSPRSVRRSWTSPRRAQDSFQVSEEH